MILHVQSYAACLFMPHAVCPLPANAAEGNEVVKGVFTARASDKFVAWPRNRRPFFSFAVV